MRVWIWPRRSWVRSSQYVSKRIFRLTGSPHAIAAGVAAGVFASFTPFMGFHFIIAFLVAYLLAGNMIASALGTFFGNPLTFPIIWAINFSFGRFLLGDSGGNGAAFDRIGAVSKNVGSALWRFDFTEFGVAVAEIWQPLLKPLLFGGLPLGIVVGSVFYVVTRRAARFFHAARQRKLMEKAAQMRTRTGPFSTGDDMAHNA